MQRMTPPRGMVPLGPQVPSTDRYPVLLIGLYLHYITLAFHSLQMARTCLSNPILKLTFCFTKIDSELQLYKV